MPSTAKLTVRCPTCGKEFTPNRISARNREGTYCSKECMYKRHKRTPRHNGDGTVTIPLNKGYETVIAADDLSLVEHLSWNMRFCNGLPYATSGQKSIRLHRIIMEAPPHLEVDHINHDTLDNRRSNLRLATRSQQLANRRYPSSSGFRGVYRKKGTEKFITRIKGRQIGTYATAEQAARAFDEAAKREYSEYATLNFTKGN